MSDDARQKLLINVTGDDEVRVGLLTNGRLEDFHIEERFERNLHGNIYLGRVVNIEPAIQAAFVDIGEHKTAFIHVSDVHPGYTGAEGIPFDRLGERPSSEKILIQNILHRSQTVLVQVTKEAIGHKGPSVTTYVSLPGRFLVLMLGMDRPGVSKRIDDPEVRDELRELAANLDPGEQLGVIIRTAGAGQEREDLERDLEYLRQAWHNIVKNAKIQAAPALLYEESELIVRTIRDLFNEEVEELWVDCPTTARQILGFIDERRPDLAERVKLYDAEEPIFFHFDLEKEIDAIYDRKVALSSGGSLVFDETEALVAIDVNSGRYRQPDDLEETAFAINCEAAPEIARQLRLRDIGGVVIIDFIDMLEADHRREVESLLRDELKRDRAKTWIAKMSRFGIVELTRQRLRPSKDKSSRHVCPVCQGRGSIRNFRAVSATIFRQLRSILSEDSVESTEVRLSPGLFRFFANERRRQLIDLERGLGKRVYLEFDESLQADQFLIVR